MMEMLEASGVMVTAPVPQQSGPPLSEYRVADQLRYELANLTVPEMCHRPEIARVLEGKDSQPAAVEAGPASSGRHANLLSGAARKHRLTPANRWLIAVLLAHAETPGRVSGLSYTRLGRLTGMSRNQLQSQLAKLRELGILAHQQPGRLGRFLGSPMTSIFLFDLHHPLFGLNDRVGLDVLWISAARPGEPFPCVVNGLVEALFVVAFDQAQATQTVRRVTGSEKAERGPTVVQHAKALLRNAFDPGPLANRLARAYDPHTASWLLARLQGYAMQLLSHGWDTLSKGRGGRYDPVAKVIDAIASDFPEWPEPDVQMESPKEPPDASAVGERDAAGTPAETDIVTRGPHARYAPHVTLLYALAHRLALELQNKLIAVTPRPDVVRLRDLSFRQVPADPQGRSLLERRGYVRRSPLQRPMDFCLIPADQGDRSLWKMQGYLRCGTGQRPARVIAVTLEPIESDMTTWLSERPAIRDPDPQARKSRKRFGRRFRKVPSQPLASPEGE